MNQATTSPYTVHVTRKAWVGSVVAFLKTQQRVQNTMKPPLRRKLLYLHYGSDPDYICLIYSIKQTPSIKGQLKLLKAVNSRGGGQMHDQDRNWGRSNVLKLPPPPLPTLILWCFAYWCHFFPTHTKKAPGPTHEFFITCSLALSHNTRSYSACTEFVYDLEEKESSVQLSRGKEMDRECWEVPATQQPNAPAVNGLGARFTPSLLPHPSSLSLGPAPCLVNARKNPVAHFISIFAHSLNETRPAAEGWVRDVSWKQTWSAKSTTPSSCAMLVARLVSRDKTIYSMRNLFCFFPLNDHSFSMHIKNHVNTDDKRRCAK